MIIVVASCLKYRDTWAPMLASIERFWPDRPWPLILVTNGREGAPFHSYFTVGRDWGWSSNLGLALTSEPISEHEHLLLLQDDFLLTDVVDTSAVQAALAVLQADRTGGSFRLMPCPGPLGSREAGRLGPRTPYGVIERGEPYRISCQATIWQRRFLAMALEQGTRSGERPDSFEIAANPWADQRHETIYCVTSLARQIPIPYLVTGIVQGEWSQDAVRLIRSLGLDPGKRRVQGS